MAKRALNLPEKIRKFIVENPDAVFLQDMISSGPYPDEYILPSARASKEEEIKNGGAFIVLGKDRPAGFGSGHSTETDCATIDIVAGRLGAVGHEIAEKHREAQAHPCMLLDAARIYISERTDVDDNFFLTPHYRRYHMNDLGFNGSVKNKSAIALKADNLRLLSREGVKIITMVDKLNSKNQKTSARYGIDLIGGLNDNIPNSDLQPIVKGKNLVECLQQLQKSVSNLDTHVAQHNAALLSLVSAGGFHFHAAAPGVTSPDINPATIAAKITASIHAMMSTVETNLKQYNHITLEANYLKPGAELYICSPYNKTT